MLSSSALTTSLVLINTLASLQVTDVYARIDLRLLRQQSQQACHSCMTSSSSVAKADENQDDESDNDVSDEEPIDEGINDKRATFVSNSIARRPGDDDLTRYELKTAKKVNDGDGLHFVEVDKLQRTRGKNQRTPEKVAVEATKNQVLRRYRQWRNENGYGLVLSSRWGRSGSNTLNEDGTIRPRSKRSVVGLLEIELPSGDEMNVDEKHVLDSYLTWRENHGYGTLAGRWG